MANLNPQVLKGFGMKSRNVRKVKGQYILGTPEGEKLIRKQPDGVREILFEHQVKSHLYNQGFQNIDMFYLAQSGLPYYEMDGYLYTMTDLFDSRELDFENDALFMQLISTVGRMHSAGRNVQGLEQAPYKRGRDLSETIGEALKLMAAIKKSIQKQTRMSEFDLVFIKNFSYYLEKIQLAGKILSTTDYHHKMENALVENCICHNLLKKENLLYKDGSIYITNFSLCSINLQIADLASVIQRHIKYKKAAFIPPRHLINTYACVHNLDSDDIKILYAFLLFPDSYIKLCGQYYSKKRKWIPAAMMEKLLQITEQQEYYNSFLEEFHAIIGS